MNTKRNIVIVSLLAVASGWLGIGLNLITGNTMPPMQSLGVLVWLTAPALAGIILRAVAGDGRKDFGWKPNFFSGYPWYLLSILVYPLIALFTFALASLAGMISAEGLATRGVQAYLAAAGVFLTGSLVKNIFEEFAWRGYLTPRLEAAGAHPLVNHLLVGVLWWSWHLPYYYHFLDRAVLEAAITTSIPAFLLIGLLVMLPTSVLFGELRLISQSVWPGFILHNLINALSMPLFINGFIKSDSPWVFVFTPTNEGVITSFLFGLTGLWLYRTRTNRKRQKI